MFKRKVQENQDVFSSKINFSLLDPRATFSDLEKVCDISYKYRYGSVCVNPCNVSYVKGYIAESLNNDIQVCSVVGFPLGANSTNSKLFELKEIMQCGASGLEVVLNIGKVKSGDFEYVKNEIIKLKKCTKKITLKIIIEACYLNENEIVKVCNICAKCKVDIVKTSTGFGSGGVTEQMIVIMQKALYGKCAIEVSGAIKTRNDALKFLNLGADKIATSYVV